MYAPSVFVDEVIEKNTKLVAPFLQTEEGNVSSDGLLFMVSNLRHDGGTSWIYAFKQLRFQCLSKLDIERTSHSTGRDDVVYETLVRKNLHGE